MNPTIKIIIADDHHLVRKGFRALLEELDFVEIVGEAANGQEVLNLLRSGKHAQVVLIDYEMPVLNGLETVERIQKEFFGVRTIMLTMLNSRELIQEAVGKGVNGFLFKNASVNELSDAVRRVAEGGTYFASDVALTLLQPAVSPEAALADRLSEREIEVLKLVAQGFSSAEIGKQLFISPRTVDTHRNNLIQKLGVNGIAGLVQFAIKHKVI
ncbi:MAG TPA: response regulator transcription factor [Flavilitoribacter sp.]|mgnify:CR=1 FL=1|nr:response regulator transcription factor [Flavilitoribacter sp.]HMQ87173.1 response regulator transcription factor [Flavilitoribacter sp.]